MEYRFKVQRRGYGIFLFLEIEVLLDPLIDRTDIQVAEGIFVRRAAGVVFMSDEYIKSYVSKAINDHTKIIREKVDGKLVCFYIKDVTANPMHFQEEGIYYAMIGWLGKYFDFATSDYAVRYDAKLRKLVFER